MHILFVTARFPYPPLKGDQVRAYHQLRLLSRHHTITLLSFTGRSVSPDHRRVIEQYCSQIITIPLTPFAMVRNLIGSLRWLRRPLQTLLFNDPRLRRELNAVLADQSFDVVHTQLARMAPHIQHRSDMPRVIDLIDALSLNMERRYRRDRVPLKWIAYSEWRKLLQLERSICTSFDQVMVVSEKDRAYIGDFPNLVVNPIGVDLAAFETTGIQRIPRSIIFSGNMSYFPNIDAARWFIHEVLPRIKSRVPDARFTIAGTNPHPALVKLAAAEPHITVTGYVDHMPSYLARSTVAVVPMQAGSGMQFKVIEAMACGTPVVATSYGLGGLDVVAGEHLLVADDAEAFSEHVLRLLNDQELRQRLASNGRALVEQRFTWEHSVAALEQLYTLAAAQHRQPLGRA